MRMSRALVAVLLAFAAALPGVASGTLTVTHLASDAELSASLPSPAFEAEGRIGDRGGSATHEVALGPSAASPVMTGHHAWQDGVAEDFELAYHQGAGEVVFTLGGSALSYTPSGSFTEVYVRAYASKDKSRCVVGGLVLDGETITEMADASGDGKGIDILRIRGGSLMDGFRLTGRATFSWDRSTPKNSQLTFEIQVGGASVTTSTQTTSWGSVKSMFRN